mmetsp:Transcript_19783/g.49869  ORF Transcript_19783/g.49869 Transcript_19783/m.49869 type:complete len:204 (+) Transcript_19783:1731-2342(+)
MRRGRVFIVLAAALQAATALFATPLKITITQLVLTGLLAEWIPNPVTPMVLVQAGKKDDRNFQKDLEKDMKNLSEEELAFRRNAFNLAMIRQRARTQGFELIDELCNQPFVRGVGSISMLLPCLSGGLLLLLQKPKPNRAGRKSTTHFYNTALGDMTICQWVDLLASWGQMRRTDVARFFTSPCQFGHILRLLGLDLNMPALR